MKVYLETSFISVCVTNRKDAPSLYRRKESLQWWASERSKFELLVSEEVLAELQDPEFPLRSEAIAFIEGIPVLDVTEETIGLARVLIQERVMPKALRGDAIHVAAATLARAEYILSWNVKHLANPNKRIYLARICMRLAYIAPAIVTGISMGVLNGTPPQNRTC